jgi:hypothetical protein
LGRLFFTLSGSSLTFPYGMFPDLLSLLPHCEG